MKRRLRSLLMICTALGCLPVAAAEPVMVRSKSGQFVVRGQPLDTVSALAGAADSVDYVRLDPSLLAVSLERIKAAMLKELGLGDAWRGTVFVLLHPAVRDGEPILITSIQHTDGWNYRLNLPEIVNRERYIRAVVQVVLREIANRKSPERQVELPPWLAEGLTAQLLTEPPPVLIPQTSARPVQVEHRSADPLRQARTVLRANTPLSLDQLNMPGEDLLDGPQAKLYQSSAHSFVHALLHLRNGRDCLRKMLARLPECLNWQTAFLEAFASHFPQMADADKWWALQGVRAAGLEPNGIWPPIEALRQLESVLWTQVEVRETPGALPLTSEASLQTILRQWPFERHGLLLEQKLNQLQALLLRTPPNLRNLVEDHARVLADCLGERNLTPAKRGRGLRVPPNYQARLSEAIKKLDLLDALRKDTREALLATAAAEPPARPTSAVSAGVGR